MDSWVLLGLLLTLFFIASLILPWILRARVAELRRQVAEMKLQIAQLSGVSSPVAVPPPAQQTTAPVIKTDEGVLAHSQYIRRPVKQEQRAPRSPKPERKKISFEQQFGARLPVWIGAIALALGALFMVKYSLENGLISESLRCALGAVFGVALIAGGVRLRLRKPLANEQRIAQALCGAGVVSLYFSAFAATTLYTLIPPVVGFAAMALTTAATVILSLKLGAPIALIGLIGGFVTPLLIDSDEPNVPVLFTYLYIVFTALLFTARKRGWWFLQVLATLAALLWAAAWLVMAYTSFNTVWVGMFVLAIAFTAPPLQQGGHRIGMLSRVLSQAGAIALMGVLTEETGYDGAQWLLYALLVAGGIGLAVFNQKQYGFVPLCSLIATLLMLGSWKAESTSLYLTVLVGFAALYAISGYSMQWRSQQPYRWALLATLSSALHLLVAYYMLNGAGLGTALMPVRLLALPWWGMMALTLAALCAEAVRRALVMPLYHEASRQHLLAVYAVACVSFITIGCVLEFSRAFLPLLFAAQLLAVCILRQKLYIVALLPLSRVLAALSALFFLPQFLNLVEWELGGMSRFDAQSEYFVLLASPLVHAALSALLFALAAQRAHQSDGDTLLGKALDALSVALCGVFVYAVLRRLFHGSIEAILSDGVALLETATITNVLLLLSIGAFYAARRFARLGFSLGAYLVLGICAIRLICLHGVSSNPWLEAEPVYGWPLFNTLLPAYALPAVLLAPCVLELRQRGRGKIAAIGAAGIVALLFIWLTLNVRHFYQGEILNDLGISNAETYTYSVAWLVFGALLLFAGTIRHEGMLRVSSLLIMLLTVGKVFVYDASELAGLYRVFSFLGLGFSLLALSYFYTRFVFKGEAQETA